MLSDKIDVKELRPDQVTYQVADDIFNLIRQQHSEARRFDKDHLINHMKSSKIVVAQNDDGRIIGMGILDKTSCLSHKFMGIHNFVILKGCDVLAIGMRVVTTLIDGVTGVEFIEGGAWLQDDNLEEILKALGFKERTRPRFRIKCQSSPFADAPSL